MTRNTAVRRRAREVALLALTALVLAGVTAAPLAAQEAPDRYWDWGVGAYFSGLAGQTDLDVALYDWVFLNFGNISATPETTAALNRFLKLNPDLKIVIRVWPIMSLGDCPQNRFQATFLHYLYQPGVREGVLKNIRDQVSVVLDHIDKPENVVGLTFLEELPGSFSAGLRWKPQEDGTLSWDLERFRAEIEAERGKPLVWDDETRLWWGEKWVQVINEINEEMKAASGGRTVIYYQMTGYTSLDMVPEGTPLSQPGLMPIRWTDIIQPGRCDGFFAYPNNRRIWDRYLDLAREHGWLFFSQVSHPGFMRLCPWDESVAMAKERLPQNLGYFLYCEGDCAASRAWNADPGIPPGPEWNTRGVSKALHQRRYLALEGVGREVLAAFPPLSLRVDLPLDRAPGSQYMHARVVVENVRDGSFYLDAAEATAREARITIRPPAGFTLEPEVSPPATLPLGDLAPGEALVADWWVTVSPEFTGEMQASFTFTATCEDATPTTVAVSEDSAIPFAETREIGISGTSWLEPAFRLERDEVRPVILIEALRDTVRNPGLGDGLVTIRYHGLLEPGMLLRLDPASGARILTRALVDDDGGARADADDPTGFRAHDDGYLVERVRVNRRISPGAPLDITVAGRTADGGQSLVVMRFGTPEGDTDASVLVNRFSADWREVSQTVTPPEGATSLEWLYLYRFRQEGTVWYGPVRVERADTSGEGLDVSGQLRGSFPAFSRRALRTFTYTDDNPPSLSPRARVAFELQGRDEQ